MLYIPIRGIITSSKIPRAGMLHRPVSAACPLPHRMKRIQAPAAQSIFIMACPAPFPTQEMDTGTGSAKRIKSMEKDLNEKKSAPCPRCSGKHKQRSEKEYRSLMNRLSRIEGQVRGLKNMLESDAYCTDIMIQVSAVNAALNCFNRELLADHLKTCVTDDIRAGHEDTLDELLKLLPKLMK